MEIELAIAHEPITVTLQCEIPARPGVHPSLTRRYRVVIDDDFYTNSWLLTQAMKQYMENDGDEHPDFIRLFHENGKGASRTFILSRTTLVRPAEAIHTPTRVCSYRLVPYLRRGSRTHPPSFARSSSHGATRSSGCVLFTRSLSARFALPHSFPPSSLPRTLAPFAPSHPSHPHPRSPIPLAPHLTHASLALSLPPRTRLLPTRT